MLSLDKGCNCLSKDRVGHSNHGGIGDIRVLQKGLFDLFCVDVEAAA